MAKLPDLEDEARQALADQLEFGRLRCPTCGQLATPERVFGASARPIDRGGRIFLGKNRPTYTISIAVCAGCRGESVFVQRSYHDKTPMGPLTDHIDWHKRLFPIGRAQKPFPNTHERHLKPYYAACRVIDLSPEASACMSRRCLQGILFEQGYKQKNLAQQIESLLVETDPKKALPADLHMSVDAIRQYGNFGAHPIDDTTTLQIIDVEPGEAEWCIELTEQLIEHYFERPKTIERKIAAANAKLKSGGKPPIKGGPPGDR
jgi:hypothetical protein